MRIKVTVELFFNPELLSINKIDKQQAVGMAYNVFDEAVAEMGELVSASVITTTVEKEGPDAAN
jgi:hypothetical protein